MAVGLGLTVSEIDRGQRSEGSRQKEIDYNSLKCNLGPFILFNIKYT